LEADPVAGGEPRDRVSGRVVVSQFEGAIAQFAVLAVFMPIVPSMGGNAETKR
jgi:Mg/Co/Ni transporter MgtE